MKYVPIISLIIVLIVSAAGFYIIQNLTDELRTTQMSYVTLYFIRTTETDFVLTPIKREITEEPTPRVALEALIKGPLPEENLEPTIPRGTKVLSLEIEAGLATADFSTEVQDNFIGGSQLESHLVTAIIKTLTQFEEIQQVQILVEGEKVESIGGHVLINEPLTGSW